MQLHISWTTGISIRNTVSISYGSDIFVRINVAVLFLKEALLANCIQIFSIVPSGLLIRANNFITFYAF